MNWIPMLTWLAQILCRDLDALCAARTKYRSMRKEHWPVDAGPVPHNTPYDHVIDRLDRALQDTYQNLEAIQSEIFTNLHIVR